MTKKKLVRKKPRGKRSSITARRAVKGRKMAKKSRRVTRPARKRTAKKRLGSRPRQTAVHQKPKSRSSRQLPGSEIRGKRMASEERPRGLTEDLDGRTIEIGDRSEDNFGDPTRPNNEESWEEDDEHAVDADTESKETSRLGRSHPGDKDGSN